MIKIKNASENNLKNISVDIPINKITSVIGVSGSGKSSLIYDVLANEAKRREKIDSGNANCFDFAIRPKFERIENLPYCITLKQRGLNQSISSTIATISKLHELLRDEFVKRGEIVGDNGNIITEPTVYDIKEFVQKYYSKIKLEYFAILCSDKYTNGKNELDILKSNNIKEAIFISSFDAKERIKKTSTVKNLNDKYSHTILVPIDHLSNLVNFKDIAVENFMMRNQDVLFTFNTDYFDIETAKIYQKKSSELLSFNSISKHGGKCDLCNGHGKVEDIDFEYLFLRDKTLEDDFLNLEVSKNGCYKYLLICKDTIQKVLKKEKIDSKQTFYDLSKEKQQIIKDIVYQKIIKHKKKPSIGKFIKTITCPMCKGTRLNYKANAIKLYNVNISEILNFTVDELYDFLQHKKLHHKKILYILEALKKATLGYLELNRTTDTLSAGELQRLKFAVELNSDYKKILYIFDEPSTGLHPYNNHQMIHLIKNLKDKGNTVIISEHNQEYIQNSDYVVELGYGSGEDGGEIIFSGKNKGFNNSKFLRKKIDVNLENSIELFGVTSNNIKNEDFIIPLNCLVSISGVSGSGKSSLIHKVLVPTVKQYLVDKTFDNDLLQNIKGIENIQSIIELTQSQIGKNSRSIVATYLHIFDIVRDIYASLDISKEFGFDKSYFSFNSDIGACESCKGLGEVDDITCPTCLGNRYKPEILDIRHNNLNIIEFLNTSISELSKTFDNEKLNFSFEILQKLGLSHITLGRITPTLSGGEAQRLKLAKTLIESYHKIKKGDFLFVLDEPTTGLSVKDIHKIYSIFDEILSFNNSIIIIEHNLEIIKNSDYIIDIGIGSGKDGGKNLFSGIFKDLLKHKTSLTAKALKKEHQEIKNIEIDKLNLKEKIYHNKKFPECNKFYLNDKHFDVEKDFSRNYKIVTDNKKHKFFKTKYELFKFVKSLNDVKISFNPYVTELFRYEIVPKSIKKEKIKHLKKLGFQVDIKDFEIDEWSYRVDIDDMQNAYNFGNGWVTIVSNNQTFELFTRLVSIQNKIIGTPKIDERTFNLYLNNCRYCNSVGLKKVYDRTLIIKDEKKSILDDGFFHSNIKFSLKSIILKFKKEELFDFTKPFNQLSIKEQNVFLFGFQEYKFLKPKGRISALGDYIKWQGIYKYVFDDLKKIEIADKIEKSKHSEICPFCKNGFKNEIQYYRYNGISLIDFIHQEE